MGFRAEAEKGWIRAEPLSHEDEAMLLDPVSKRVLRATRKVIIVKLSMVIGVVSLKFIEGQPQILRLTTPELKDVRGPVRSE